MIRNRKASKIGTVAAIMASVILSGTTAFAYAPMQTTENNADSDTTSESFTFTEDKNYNKAAIDSQIYFTYPDGTVVTVDNSDLDTRAIICTHDFVSGYADSHNSKSDGGCIVRTYKARKCKKCNHLVLDELISTTNYVKCPHK